MLTVFIPNKFRPEIEYTLDVLLGTFLGLKFEIKIHGNVNFDILLPNDNKLSIQNSFFNRFQNPDEYLLEINIPDKAQFTESEFGIDKNIPVIYGDLNFKVTKQEISCGPDIIASSFFMLSRWEEYAITEKNEHGNFPSQRSFAQKNNIHYRPLVNEYVELLWNMLVFLGFSEKRKKRNYTLKITHDVDQVARYDNIPKYLRALAGDIIHRKKPGMIFNTTSDYLKIKQGKINDPYDTFDYLMDISEKHNLKSHFYFIPSIKGETDFRYAINENKAIKAIQKIKERRHVIGIHPSFSTFKNKWHLKTEIDRLQNYYSPITEGRQHYLKFSNPDTWQDWEDVGLKSDSTLGYENDMGFRAGVCYPYPVFNILTRKKLDLIEEPLIVMEGALVQSHPELEDFKSELKQISETVKKYNGTFVFLWHNNNLYAHEWKIYGKHYENIIKNIV